MSSPFPQPEGYELHRVIGRGGAATVYEAVDSRHGRSVAVKVLTDEALGGDEMSAAQRRAFTREVRAMGRLGDHPNVVTVYDSGFLPDGRPYLVMPLITAGSLAARLRAEGPLPVQEVLDIGVKVASALETAHQRGILHCDVKPSNLLVGPWGDTLLADFGIASVSAAGVTTTGSSSLTIAYAAPEIIADEPATIESDIYSLGVTLFTLLDGATPFSGESPAAIVHRIMEEADPPTPDAELPDSLRSLLRDMMAKEPEDRPQAVSEVVDGLQSIQRERGGPVTAAIYEAAPVETASPLAELPTEAGRSEAASPPASAGFTTEVTPELPRPRVTARRDPQPRSRRPVVIGGVVLLAALVVGVVVWLTATGDAEEDPIVDGATATPSATGVVSPSLGVDVADASVAPTGPLPTSDPAAEGLRLFDPSLGGPAQDVAVPHRGGVGVVAISSAGFLASGGADDSVRLWNLEGELLNALGHDGPVRDVEWSPDGLRLAVADDEEVRVWDVVEGSALSIPDSADISDLAWNGDGTLLAGGGQGRVVLWEAPIDAAVRTDGADPSDGPVPVAEPIAEITSGEHSVWSVAVSPDDGTIAALTSEGNVYEWAVGAPTEPIWSDERSIETYDGTVVYLDDGSLVAGSADSPIRIHDPASGLFEIDDEWDPVGIVPSPTGSLLLSVGQTSAVRVVHVGLGDVVGRLDTGGAMATSAAWSPDGRIAVTGDLDGLLHVWSMASPAAPILRLTIGAS